MALMYSPEPVLIKKILLKNILLNILGLSLPLMVGFISMPIIISGLGKERFGILSLAWMLLGYASLFDLGLGRATTRFIASALSHDQKEQIPSIFWTTIIAQLSLGIVGTIILWMLTPLLVTQVFKIPIELQAEARSSLYVLALGVPLLLVFSSFSGLLEVWQRFDLINAVKIPLTSMNFLSAAAAYFFPLSLAEIILAIVVFRLLGALLLFFGCCRQIPELIKKIDFRGKLFPQLITFGGWVTISNLAAPFLVYFERFLIGAMLSMEAVSYYTAPYEIITRLWILPASFVLTLFPIFSSWDNGRREELNKLFFQALKLLFLLMGPGVLFLSLTARQILQLWLGKEFVIKSSLVFQILAWGVLINSLAHLPLAFLQGLGRPDLPAKFHLMEIPLYALVALVFVRLAGIEGAALAWTFRVIIDALLLFRASMSKLPNFFSFFKASKSQEMLIGFCTLIIVDGLMSTLWKSSQKNWLFVFLLAGSILLFFIISWKRWFLPSEKDFIRQLLRK